MNISLTNQAIVFWIAVLDGALTGVIFDFFRAFRRRVRSGNLSVAVQDILFWLISAGVVFSFMYRFNDGEARWYIFCGVILGAVIYYNTISNLILELVVKLYSLLGKIVIIIIKILLFPAVLLFKILRGPFFIVMMPIKGAARIIGKISGRLRSNWSKNIKRIKKRLKMY